MYILAKNTGVQDLERWRVGEVPSEWPLASPVSA